VRIVGQKTLTKTFDKIREAQVWIAATETGLRQIRATEPNDKLNLSQVLIKYRDEILAQKPYKVSVSVPSRFAVEFAGVTLVQMTHEWWLKSVQDWAVKPASAKRYMLFLVGALRAAEDLKWGIKVDWESYHEARKALSRRGLIATGRARDRRVSDEEIALLKQQLTGASIPLADMMDFAVGTAMRVGEICRITWVDIDQRSKVVIIRDRKDPKHKSGNDKKVPLLGSTLEIIKRQPTTDSKVFPWKPNSVSRLFTYAARVAGIQNIHFHDLRHEAITRLFEQGFAIPEVAIVSGHTNWDMLRKYTHIKPESLHGGPRQARIA